ncbi:MAG: hypothetical protein WAQ27_02445 [Candidatus Microsaccharimonas sp.]
MITSTETPRKSEEVTALLTDSFDWSVPATAEPLHRDNLLNRFDAIALANAQVHGSLPDDFHKAFEASSKFVMTSFDYFENKTESDRFDWTFNVPARGEDSQGEEYASEVTFFLPLLDPKFGVNAMIRQRSVAHLAPAVIETYKGTQEGMRGALVWTPAYVSSRLMNDKSQRGDHIKAAHYRIDEAAGFVRHKLGAKVMGLGAVMPGMTSFGRTIQQEGLVTTTGHGGTVHLVAETVKRVAQEYPRTPRIGILGLGSIGDSAFRVLSENNDSLPVRSFILYDKRHQLVTKALAANRGATPLIAPMMRPYGGDYESEASLLNTSDIIVTAITSRLDLDKMEQKLGRPIDLTGKTIIDDSQPGCFDRVQVEARGGCLVWVVGEDTSDQHYFKRINNYAYGEGGGLSTDRSVWGCEAEAGSIAMTGLYDQAVKTSVNADIARKVGKVCHDIGIRVSNPLQSFGQPVDI